MMGGEGEEEEEGGKRGGGGETRVKLDNEHWYDHVPKSVKIIREGTVTIMESTSANQQSQS